jgi:hypothetical protein
MIPGVIAFIWSRKMALSSSIVKRDAGELNKLPRKMASAAFLPVL